MDTSKTFPTTVKPVKTSSEVSNLTGSTRAGAMKKRTKKILDWIDAFIVLCDLDVKYFYLSINAVDKPMRRKYRAKSDQYHKAIDNLLNLIP